MPYEWIETGDGTRAELHLWPYRSLPRKGFVLFIAATATLLALPLVAVLGTVILWGLLPFIGLAIAGVWWALSYSYRQGELLELLSLSHDRISLVRHAPDGTEQRWDANPYWVAVRLYPTGTKVPNYLTLKGEGREVELGAFLSEEERVTLAEELRDALAALR